MAKKTEDFTPPENVSVNFNKEQRERITEAVIRARDAEEERSRETTKTLRKQSQMIDNVTNYLDHMSHGEDKMVKMLEIIGVAISFQAIVLVVIAVSLFLK